MHQKKRVIAPILLRGVLHGPLGPNWPSATSIARRSGGRFGSKAAIGMSIHDGSYAAKSRHPKLQALPQA
jgi:hypothetical protein